MKKLQLNNYNFNLERYIKDGWSLFNREAGPFIGMTFLFFLIEITLNYIPIINLFTNLIGSLLSAGFYIYCRKIKQNTQQASDFIGGFYFVKDIFLYFLTMIILILPAVLLLVISFGLDLTIFQQLIDISQSGNPEDLQSFTTSNFKIGPLFIVSIMLLFVYVIYLAVSYIFAIPLIVDAKLSFWEAMELSRKTVGMKLLSFIGSTIFLGILAAFGAIISCGVGLLLIIPLASCITFEAYDQIFNRDAFIEPNEV